MYIEYNSYYKSLVSIYLKNYKMKYKATIIISILLISTSQLFAQEKNKNDEFKSKSLSFKVGHYPLLQALFVNYGEVYNNFSQKTIDNFHISYSPAFFDRYCMNLTYINTFNKFGAYGIKLGYYNSRYYLRKDGTYEDGYNYIHSIQANFIFRITYVNKKYFKLYSSFDLGLMADIGDFRDKDIIMKSYLNSNFAIYPTGHLNIIGFEVGDKLFFTNEFGIGNSGFVQIGFGYRF